MGSYKLFLTDENVMTISWAKDRYGYGDIMGILNNEKVSFVEKEDGTEYDIPEHLAWEIKDLILDDTQDFETKLPCAPRDLEERLFLFCDEII